MNGHLTISTRDVEYVPPSSTKRRVWYGRGQIMEMMLALGMPASIDKDMIIIRGCEREARWLTLASDMRIRSMFDGPKFADAMDMFQGVIGTVRTQSYAAPGLSFRNGRAIIDGSALSVDMDGGVGYIIPISRLALERGTEWIETVAVIPTSSLKTWNMIQYAASMADRMIDASTSVLRMYNGPDIAIQAVDLDDIIMEPEVKSGFVDDITAFMSRRQWYADRGIPWTRRYALNGLPGTGKTSLMRWACTSLGMPSVGFDFTDRWADGRDFNGLMAMAARMAPCIVSLDDMDRVLSGDNATNINRHTIQTALSGMGNMDGVIVIATCNDTTSLLDGPMARRFDAVVEVPLPTAQLRAAYLMRVLAMDGVSEDKCRTMAGSTDGWSYSDLMSAVTAAANAVTARRGNQIEERDLDVGVRIVSARKRDR